MKSFEYSSTDLQSFILQNISFLSYIIWGLFKKLINTIKKKAISLKIGQLI